jgi:hypothetical protein
LKDQLFHVLWFGLTALSAQNAHATESTEKQEDLQRWGVRDCGKDPLKDGRLTNSSMVISSAELKSNALNKADDFSIWFPQSVTTMAAPMKESALILTNI